ncbi:phosphate acyltransferase PlsX [candidate division GN15 bacterium]|uniref:Phosphate acyltransferase n=1 Tax=candidate division GN15 bacterium TaxID=2072418 RepID=A0A855WXW2_9BACT|nr:MAG: phosphate acyltransferase PlsX [candidate division GN15 bacterium]
MMTNGTCTVALDVMGADGGPQAIIEGGLTAARQLGGAIHIVFVGRRDQIEPVLSIQKHRPDNLSVQHAETEVPMHIAATDGVRMRDSSVAVGLRLVKRHQANAFVSPGNTGAVMATSLLTLGRIKGVSRPAITAVFPTSSGIPTVVLDVGANADCKPHHLSQFAVMGSVYASVVLHKPSPRVGLLSIGEERSKGNDLIFSAHELLKDSKINFIGNIEGRDILSGNTDVAVTDGFTGNILLKFAESIQPMFGKLIKRQVDTNVFSRFGVFLMRPFLRRMKRSLDYAEAGGAPLLGVNGTVIICHGSSNSRAIYNAVKIAYEMWLNKVKERIHDDLITNHFGRENESKDTRTDIRDGVVHPAAPDDQC